MLHTPQAQLQQRLITLQQTLQATPAGMPLARTLASWLTRLHDQPATLLLLGNYNAGKSTLVNVLSGEALAPTGDIPLTDRVIDYPWQGLCLRDTPGLNAPIPHQAVTEAALASADLVVVVVRSGDVDEACLYRQLASLLQRGNPLLIVLNGDSSEPALLACWQQQLCRHLLALEQMGIPPAQLAAIPVIPLNLETAWQARQQGGPLLAASGYPLLASTLQQWATRQLAGEPWRAPLLACMQQGLTQLLQQGAAEPASQSLLTARQQLQHLAQRLQKQGRLQLTCQLNAQRPALTAALHSTDPQTQVAMLVETLCHELQSWLASEQPDRQWRALNPMTQPLPHTAPAGPLTDPVDEAMKLGMPLLQGGLAKVGGRLNLAISLLLGAAEIYRQQREQSRQAELARDAKLLEMQQLSALSQQLESTIALALDEAIRATLAEPLTRLEQQLAELARQASADARQRLMWQQWLEEIAIMLAPQDAPFGDITDSPSAA
ncbi:GTPase [Aeromonas veronii]|uniref:GTPase n=1 Tax=Aeromonas veronii TaxID=654 RepID=UPI002B49119B|nr:GTPase [Aeromonas veronii]